MKRTSLSVGGATGPSWDHQLQVLPPPLVVLGDQDQQVDEVVVVLVMVEQVVETEA